MVEVAVFVSDSEGLLKLAAILLAITLLGSAMRGRLRDWFDRRR
jgi:hypothetical protein